MPAYVEWLRHYVKERGYDELVLVGNSLGGAIAQLYALTYPLDLRAIVLVGTGARLRVAPHILQPLEEDYPTGTRLFADYSLSQHPDPRLKEKLLRWMLHVPQEVTVGDLRACDAFDVMGQVGKIAVPTQVVNGTEDRLTPAKYGQYLADHIGGARLVLIKGAGHMVMLEKPEDFNQALAEFLGQI